MNRRREGILPERVEQPRVQNRDRSSATTARTGRTGQFVPQVAREIGKLDPDLDLMVQGPKRTEAAANALIEAASGGVAAAAASAADASR